MKKMTILAVLLALAVALTACGSKNAQEPTAAATVPAEAAPNQVLTLTDWTMSASTWSSPNGATIHISATPNFHTEGQTANFVVRLESDDIVCIPCQWDGTAYTASADLNAADGYCYYVVLTAADGTAAEVAVNTPAAPTNEAFINMETSLKSYCSIIVEESDFKGSQLKLTAGTVQVQVPAITNAGETISCQEAVLVLSHDGKELGKQVLTLKETGTAGLYEAALSGITFQLPALEEDQRVELMLNALLSNGQSMSAYGGNWIFGSEELLPVVG